MKLNYVFLIAFLLFSCNEKVGVIKDTELVSVPMEDKKSLFKIFLKKDKKINLKKANIGDMVTVVIPKDADFSKINIAFLVDGYSSLDKKFFAKEGGTRSRGEIKYIGLFSENGKTSISGSKDEKARTISFRIFDLFSKDIAGLTYKDLGIIFGNGGNEVQDFFRVYRGSFPVKDVLVINSIEEVVKDNSGGAKNNSGAVAK